MQKFVKPTLIIYGIYLVLALLVITPALNILPSRYVQDTYSRDLQTRYVWLNPFTLSLEVRGLELPESNGEQFLALESASINLSLSSLFRKGVVLDALRVSDLYVHAAMLTEDTFNFSDFMVAGDSTEKQAEEEPAGIPGITIHEVDLHSKTIKLSDLSRDEAWSSQWHELNIQANDISTVLVEGKPYSIELAGAGGGTLRWAGEVSIPKSQSEGKLQITGLNLKAFWRFAEPWVQFELVDGALDISARYRVNWEDTVSYNIEEGSIDLKALDIRPKKGVELPDTGIALDSFSIQGIGVDSEILSVDVQALNINGLAIAGYSEAEVISLQQLFAPVAADETSQTNPAEEPAHSGDTTEADAPQWQAKLATATLSDSSIAWRSEYTEPPLMNVTPINLKLTSLAWPLAGTSTASLSLTANEQATLAIDGTVELATGDGELSYKLAQLVLPWFNPNLPKDIKAELGSGELALDGSASLREFAPVQVGLDGALTELTVKERDSDKTLSGLKALNVDDLVLDFDAQHVALQTLTIDGLNGRLYIDSDGTINTSHLVAEEVVEVAAAEDGAESAQAPVKTQEPPEDASETQEPDSTDAPWSIDVPRIVIRDSSLDFADESLSKNFRTDIKELDGEITGLSSSSTEPAKVNLTGSVEGYAPVALNGTMQPLHTPPMIDLALSFARLDMSRFTPYSGTYTGRAIERGLLSINLDYEMQDNRLKGRNNIVMSKLKFGDKVESDKALDLPLELALSLLTDSKGVIDLDVPVTGNLDDPKFQLGSVIVKAFTQVLISAVTAPFSLLAGLVDSDDDFQHIVFAPGSADLDAKNKEMLTELTGALAQRPKLSLELAGQLHPETDAQRLQRKVLDQQLLGEGLAQADLEGRTPAWQRVVSKRYQKLDDVAEDSKETVREQYRQVAAAIEIPSEQLTELVVNRAEAVRSFLVEEAGLAPERVTIDPDRINDKSPAISGVQLFLDS